MNIGKINYEKLELAKREVELQAQIDVLIEFKQMINNKIDCLKERLKTNTDLMEQQLEQARKEINNNQ